MSNVNKWDKFYSNITTPLDNFYGDNLTFTKASEFLADTQEVEDWGCGPCGFKLHYKGQTYIGIDGSHNILVNKNVDLETYLSNVESILMRHILEHNYEWKKILYNACSSFKRKMCLILFTPFGEETKQIRFDSLGVPDISFKKNDLIEIFQELNIKFKLEENIKTKTQYGIEHIFYLEK